MKFEAEFEAEHAEGPELETDMLTRLLRNRISSIHIVELGQGENRSRYRIRDVDVRPSGFVTTEQPTEEDVATVKRAFGQRLTKDDFKIGQRVEKTTTNPIIRGLGTVVGFGNTRVRVNFDDREGEPWLSVPPDALRVVEDEGVEGD